jgi:hypothetical protein
LPENGKVIGYLLFHALQSGVYELDGRLTVGFGGRAMPLKRLTV